MSMFQLAEPEKPKQVDVSKIEMNMDNCHNMSAFELRQWLVRENLFNEAEFGGQINQKTLMQKVVQSLLERQAAKLKLQEDTQKEKEDKGEVETLQQKLTRQKAERKAAAIARSKARQADANYFKQVQDSNDEGKAKLDKKKEEADNAEVVEEEGQEEEPEADDDPFRPSWKKGQRNKIFTR